MEFSRIIIRPMHTEKSYAQQNEEPKKHAFIVDINATKTDIKLAFESIYGFAPTCITTQIRKPAKIRTGTAKPGFTKRTKIAYVTLPIGKSISASEEKAETKSATKAEATSTTLKEVKETKKPVESSIKEVKPTTTVAPATSSNSSNSTLKEVKANPEGKKE